MHVVEAEISLKKVILAWTALLAFWSLAVAQPLFDLLGGTPEFWVARNNEFIEIISWALLMMLAVPLFFLLLEIVISRFSSLAYEIVHTILFALFLALLISVLAKEIFAFTPLLVIGSLVLGVFGTYFTQKSAFLRQAVSFLSFAPIFVFLMFLFLSPSSSVIFSSAEAGPIDARATEKTPVVIIAFDEFPAVSIMDREGNLDSTRFPGFLEMAKESTWYKNATTSGYFTPIALPSILSGQEPEKGMLPTSRNYPNNVFQMLRKTHKINAKEAITKLCPSDLCTDITIPSRGERFDSLVSDTRFIAGKVILPPLWADSMPNLSTSFENFDDQASKSSIQDPAMQALVMLDGRTISKRDASSAAQVIPNEDNSLTFLHLMVPHQPWRFTPDGKGYGDEGIPEPREGNDAWTSGEGGIASVQQKHLLQAGYADNILKGAIDSMKSSGLWERAMVVIVADHGVAFEKGTPPRRGSRENMGEIAFVPLFIKYPGQSEGEIDERHVRTVDIVPTIAEELRVEEMFPTDGFPLQKTIPDNRPVKIIEVEGSNYTLQFSKALRQRAAALERKYQRFGSGSINELGPRSDLIGKKAPDGISKIKIYRPEAFDWKDGPRPILFSGEIPGGREDALLAATVDGVVVATTRAFKMDGKIYWSVVLPRESIKPGKNNVSIYKIVEDNLESI